VRFLVQFTLNKLAILWLQGWQKGREARTQCCHLFHLHSRRLICGNLSGILPFHSLMAIGINDGVSQNPVEPGNQPVVIAKIRRPLQCLEEAVLEDILGYGGVCSTLA
jgi:hypothetical protein